MRKGLVINENVWPMIDDLMPDEKGSLLCALSAFYHGEEPPDMERIVRMVFKQIADDNERFDPESRKRLSDIRAEAGRKGGSKPKQNKQTEANESKISKIAQDKDKEKDKDEDKKKNSPSGSKKKNPELTFPESLNQDFVREAFDDFRDMRERNKKPMTPRAEELIVRKLERLSGGDPVEAVKILEQSTVSGWSDVYELHRPGKQKPKINWEVL